MFFEQIRGNGAHPLAKALVDWNLLEEPENRKEIAVLFEYAQFLVATSDLDTLSRGYAPRLVRLLSWAQNPLIRRANIAFCLIVDKLAELNERLTSSPYVALIEIPLPTSEERRALAGVPVGGAAEHGEARARGAAAAAADGRPAGHDRVESERRCGVGGRRGDAAAAARRVRRRRRERRGISARAEGFVSQPVPCAMGR